MNSMLLMRKIKNYECYFLIVLCLISLMPIAILHHSFKRPHQNIAPIHLTTSELMSIQRFHEMEMSRNRVQNAIKEQSEKLKYLRGQTGNLKNEINMYRQELEDIRFQKRKIVNTCPQTQLSLAKPSKDILSKLSHSQFKKFPKPTVEEKTRCKLSRCFSFQSCPYGQAFLAHVYRPGLSTGGNASTQIYNILKTLSYTTTEVDKPMACLYVVIIDPSLDIAPKALEKGLHNLRFWQGSGHNHIIINFAKVDLLATVDTGRAMIAQTTFGPRAPYRREFDVVIPPLVSLGKSGPVWENSAPQLPANRKYMLSFMGNYRKPRKGSRNENTISVDDLKQLSSEANDMLIQLSCQVDEEFSSYNDWKLCWSHNERAKVLKASTFTLIIQFGDDQTMTLVRLMEALQYGAIPVLISDNVLLPFSDLVDWHRAAIILHEARFSQINFVLKTISVNDLLDIRRQGRFLWETYFSTTQTVLQSVLAAIQTRLFLPGIPAKDTKLLSIFSEESQPRFNYSNADLGSPIFSRIFTTNTVYYRESWNNYPGALLLYPSSPFVPVLPSSAAFLNSSDIMQPIEIVSRDTGPGSAQKALGGDHAYEQFTIVVVTYQREKVLQESIARFAHLRFLNKVIVIWNSPKDPSLNLTWPNIGVPIKVLRPEKNSLNNRFLPLDEIETDAVLSLDDDVFLDYDEIIFGFRVWREARDRIVGYPARYHSWNLNNGEWYYNTNYSCEISMVITGASFFHKYYSYLYTHVMPQAIRDKVDEYTNCEDIAMNFLVSHVTRKPPIKVTSRYSLPCPGCSSSLYLDESHYNERHRCINFFEKVFGYMPLLHTQFHAEVNLKC